MLKGGFERSLVKNAYTEDEMKLRAIFASCPDAIAVSDLNGNITECNQATLDMHGFSSKDELIGRNGFELIARRDHEKAKECLKKVLEQGSIRNVEFSILAKDGREFPVEFSASVMKDSSGKATGFVAITKEITDRKEAEKALYASEERYGELTESIGDVFFAMDNDLRYTYWNQASENLVDVSAKDAIGKSIYEIFPNVKGTKIERLYLETLRKKQPQSFVTDYRLRGKDYVFEINAYPSSEGLSVFVKDITERRKAEQAVRESQQRFERLFSNIPEATVYWDVDFRVLDINQRFTELFGYSLDEIKGKLSSFLVPNDKLEDIEILMEKARKGYVNYDTFRKRKNGSLVSVSISVAPIIVEGQLTGLIGLYTDITEREEAQKTLLENQQKFERLFKANPEATVVLDLNTRIVNINPRFCELFGYSLDEAKGKVIKELIVPKDKTKESEMLTEKG